MKEILEQAIEALDVACIESGGDTEYEKAANALRDLLGRLSPAYEDRLTIQSKMTLPFQTRVVGPGTYRVWVERVE